MPRSFAAACIIRSWKNIASVTRNEHRYATPPGDLFVYSPRAARCGACVVMYTVSLDVDRLKSAMEPQHSIGLGCDRG